MAEEKKNNNKIVIIVIVTILSLFLLWIGVFSFWSNRLDKKIDEQTLMTPNIIEELNKKKPIIEIIKVTYNDTEMSLDELIENENITAGTIFKATVKRDDGTQEDMNAYLVVENDNADMSYEENSGYLKIFIPEKR